MDQIRHSIEQHLTQPGGLHHWFLWASALACFLASYFSARHISKDPRLFTVLALFAGAWVLVMAGVDTRVREPTSTSVSDRAFDVASFLFVFSGTVLAREAMSGSWLQWAQRWVQVAGLWFLFVLVLPSQLPMKLPLSDEKIELIVGEFLSATGFLAILLGTKAVSRGSAFGAIALVAVLYECLSVSRTLELFNIDPSSDRPFMVAWQVYLFILMRFLLTGLYCYAVVSAYHQKLRGTIGTAHSEAVQTG